MRSRAQDLTQLREIFRLRVQCEVLAAVALGQMTRIDWQDALDAYTDAIDTEVAKMTARLAETGGKPS